MKSTAIYTNRIQDKLKVESILKLSEFGNDTTIFHYTYNDIFAIGYNRIVYGDHGAYVEFTKDQIVCQLKPKFKNNLDVDNLPDEKTSEIYYYWLYPCKFPNIKVYLQIKPVIDLPNAPKRTDGKKSDFNRIEGYADYKRGFYYVDPFELLLI